MVNWLILAYLGVTIVCMFIMAFIMQRQFKEVRRPKNDFTKLRIYLFISPAAIFLGLATGLPQLIYSLHLQTSPGQNVRVISGMVVLSVFSLSKLLIYTYREKK